MVPTMSLIHTEMRVLFGNKVHQIALCMEDKFSMCIIGVDGFGVELQRVTSSYRFLYVLITASDFGDKR
jgi:hypothetical protein